MISCQPEGDEDSARLLPSPWLEPLSFEEEEEEAEAEKRRRKRRERSSPIDNVFSLPLPPAACALASLLEPRASRSIISVLFLK